MCLTEKLLGASLRPRWCRFSPHVEVVIYLLFHSFNATEGWEGLSFSYLLSTFSKMVQFAHYKRTLSSVQFKIINNNNDKRHFKKRYITIVFLKFKYNLVVHACQKGTSYVNPGLRNL